MKIWVSIERGIDDYYIVRCPTLKSCWSQGKTREEALVNIREAIELYLEPDIIPASNQEDNAIFMQEIVV